MSLTVAATGYLVGTLSSRHQSPPDPAAAMPTAAHSATPSTTASAALPAPATSNGTAPEPAHHPTTATPPGQGTPVRPGPSTVKLGATEASYAYDRPFVFKNQVTGRALEAPKANGNVSQQPITGAAQQQWKLHADSDGSQLISVATGQCLRVPPRESDTGVLRIQACGSDPVADEHWDIYNSPNRGIALRNKASTGCMSLRSPATTGAAVVHFTCSWKPTDDQVWLLLNIAP
ncbi:RICIN domain-containing protein [Actinoplanes sp. NPDC049681]|uniref:RICIN domain-containing protein n=1 Tax=Actinoplanes sp. NPDC049681 TaxID=3363905 RepID=UPI00379222B1